MIVSTLSFCLLLVAGVLPQDAQAPLTARERAVHLLSRFAFGPRPGQVERLLEVGEERWLAEQLDPAPRGPEALAERLSEFETLGMTPAQVYEYTYFELPGKPSRQERQQRTLVRMVPMLELEESVVLRQTYASDQLEEVLREFWRNHFNVSYTKGWPAGLYIPDYDARVIGDHALGSFSDLLYASAHHSAMMHYLDNALSRRPPSSEELAKLEQKIKEKTGSKELAKEAAEIASTRGVNENYARELLELHTLGVDRSYRQKDVIAAAEALTGWGVGNGGAAGYGFLFDDQRHMDGAKRFLTFVLREDKQRGTGQGDRLLELLAKHNDTAEFIATKLVRYLVNDVPPPALVQDVAQTFKDKDGDIPAMLRTVLESDEFWSRANYQAKFKTPNEFLISAIRITGARIESFETVRNALKTMGQPTYHCDDPTGYYDTADAWLDPGVMAKRWDIALSLAAGELEGVVVPRSFFGAIEEDETAREWLQDMVQRVLPGGASTRTLAMVHEVLRRHTRKDEKPNLAVLGPQILGLLLGSPEFQKQ